MDAVSRPTVPEKAPERAPGPPRPRPNPFWGALLGPIRGGRERALRGVYLGYMAYAATLNRLWPSVTLPDGAGVLHVAPSVYKPIQNEQRVAAFVPADGRVLEVGCGSGVLSIGAARRSRHVTAVDVNPAAVATTRRNAAAHGVTNLEVREGDAFALALEDAAFDTVLCGPPFLEVRLPGAHRQWASVEGFLPRLFASARRWLTPDGTLILHYMTGGEPRVLPLATEHGFTLQAVHPNHTKPWPLRLQGWLYLQPGPANLGLRLHPRRPHPHPPFLFSPIQLTRARALQRAIVGGGAEGELKRSRVFDSAPDRPARCNRVGCACRRPERAIRPQPPAHDRVRRSKNRARPLRPAPPPLQDPSA